MIINCTGCRVPIKNQGCHAIKCQFNYCSGRDGIQTVLCVCVYTNIHASVFQLFNFCKRFFWKLQHWCQPPKCKLFSFTLSPECHFGNIIFYALQLHVLSINMEDTILTIIGNSLISCQIWNSFLHTHTHTHTYIHSFSKEFPSLP